MQPIGNRIENILRKKAVGQIGRTIGDARPRIDYDVRDRVSGKGRRLNLVVVNIGAQQQRVAIADLLIDIEVETKNVRALALIRDRSGGIAVAALIDPLLALAVIRDR